VIKTHPEIATNYVAAKKTGISETSVRNIKRRYGAKPVESEVNIIKSSYGWMKRNVCWSMDTMMIRFMGGWLYALLVIEESSRLLLSYKIAEQKQGIYARELLTKTVRELGAKPLVVKHDRGREFENEDFQTALKDEQIVSLPAPGYYAPFNSMAERTIRLVRRFTMPLEIRYDATLEEVDKALFRAQREINYELPRKMFNGRTSGAVYESTPDYDPPERERLLEDVYDYQEILDPQYFRCGKTLDRMRKEVVEYLCRRNLCYVEHRVKKVKLKQCG